MTNKSILFVDDEPNILSGLKRMFRNLRQEKDFHFVESGQEALDFMAMLDSSKVKLVIKPKPKKVYNFEEAPF